jgi:hypothetical protein
MGYQPNLYIPVCRGAPLTAYSKPSVALNCRSVIDNEEEWLSSHQFDNGQILAQRPNPRPLLLKHPDVQIPL